MSPYQRKESENSNGNSSNSNQESLQNFSSQLTKCSDESNFAKTSKSHNLYVQTGINNPNPLQVAPQSTHHITNTLSLSPASAALSTAAAVAAIGSCNDVAGPQPTEAIVAATVDLNWLDKSGFSNQDNNTTFDMTHNTTNLDHNLRHQQQQVSPHVSATNSANTSKSTTPCHTPGPLPPPPSRLLPQNQLVFNHRPNNNNNISINKQNLNSNYIGNNNTSTQHRTHPGAPLNIAITNPSQTNMAQSFYQRSGTTTVHGNSATANAPIYHPAPVPMNTNIFANTSLRRGKWTAVSMK